MCHDLVQCFVKRFPLGRRQAGKNILISLLDQLHGLLPKRFAFGREGQHHPSAIGLIDGFDGQALTCQGIACTAGIGFIEICQMRQMLNRQGLVLPDGGQAAAFAQCEPQCVQVGCGGYLVAKLGDQMESVTCKAVKCGELGGALINHTSSVRRAACHKFKCFA